MTLTHYRLLFILSLGGTLLLLLLPGNCLEELQQSFYNLWPWGRSTSLKFGRLPTDKLIHGSMFAVCGFLLVKGWSLRIYQSARPWGLLLLAGFMTELLHMLLPGRSMELSDMLANALGSTTGMLLARPAGPVLNPKKASESH